MKAYVDVNSVIQNWRTGSVGGVCLGDVSACLV